MARTLPTKATKKKRECVCEREREKIKGERTGRRHPTGCEHVLSALCAAPELWENLHTGVSLALNSRESHASRAGFL